MSAASCRAALQVEGGPAKQSPFARAFIAFSERIETKARWPAGSARRSRGFAAMFGAGSKA